MRATLFSLAIAGSAASDSGWTSYLALPNITAITTTLTTGNERYLDVEYNGGKRETFTITSELSLDGVSLPEGLESLTLNRLNLNSIPHDFQWPTTLQKLDLSSNSLSEFPENVKWPNGLKELSLSKNKLSTCVSDLPESITDLDLSSNEISCIRSCAWPSGLQKLHLSGNSLKVLYKSQKWPTQLKELHLDSTGIKHVPSTLPEGLTQLQMNYNKIQYFPKTLPASVSYLSLSNNMISVIPAALDKFPALDLLQLSDNKIASLPENLVLPKDFRMLYLSNNQLTALPKSCGWLDQIDTLLQLDGNQLTSLPAGIRLPKQTNLAKNKITALEEIALPTHLNINNNPLERIEKVTVSEGSFWQTSSTTLKSFTLKAQDFEKLESMLNGYTFFSVRWKTDDASIETTCKAQNGQVKSIQKGTLSICVINDSY